MRALRGSWVVVVVALAAAVIAATRPPDCTGGTLSYSISGPGGTENTDLAVRLGGREERVTEDGLSAHSSLSPDARRVAFESAQGGSFSDTVGYSQLAIHVADVDGGNRETLTTGRHDTNPDWAPDGAKVLFLRQRGVWTVDVATKEEALVYKPPAREASVVDASWPGDSSRIAFFVHTDAGEGATELWVVGADGSHPHRVAALGEGRVGELAWSPNGQTFAWTAFEGEDGDVFMMPAAFAVPRLIERDARTPIWSRDGDELAYVTGREDHDRLQVVVGNADATEPRPLPDSPRHVHDWISC